MTGREDTPARILVTGACGFVGTAVVQCAVRAGLTVRRTDRAAQLPREQTPYVCADICRPETLATAMSGMDAVVHAAGLAHVFDKSKQSCDFSAVNETGTANVTRAAVAAGVGHLVLVSSVSVYGAHRSLPCGEDAPCRPEGAYATSKYRAERRAEDIAARAGMGLTILRMATIYGRGDPGNVARLIRSVDEGRFFWIGSGSNSKSLLHRDDAARACIAAVSDPAAGIRTWNVSARPCTMREIVTAIARHLDRPLRRRYVPGWLARGGSALAAGLCLGLGPAASVHRVIRKWLADDVYPAERIARELGFCTEVGLDDGLRDEVAWYRQASASTT